jgi:hypothetical protein
VQVLEQNLLDQEARQVYAARLPLIELGCVVTPEVVLELKLP